MYCLNVLIFIAIAHVRNSLMITFCVSFFLADSALVDPEATGSKSDITSDVATTLLQLISQQASESRHPATDLCPGGGPSSPPSATSPPTSSYAPSPAADLPNAAPETQFTQDQDLRYTLGGAAGPS